MEKLIVSKKDLYHNIEIVKNYISEHAQGKMPRIIGVVKANGYGMGLLELSNEYIQKGIDMLAVSKYEEGIELRQNNIYCDILFLSSTAIPSEAKQVIENDIIPTIGSIESLRVYNEIGKERQEKINVHIKVETGFSRHGIRIEDIDNFVQEYTKCEYIQISGIFTHFIESFASDSITVDKQYQRYIQFVDKLKEEINLENVMLHVCNSSAVFKYPKYYLDAVRVGSAFIGSLPFENSLGLKKLGYLECEVAEIKSVKKGDSIGYGKIYIAPNDMTLAIVQAGYTSGIGVQIQNNNVGFLAMLRQIKHELKKYIKKENLICIINDKKYNIVSGIRMNNIFVDVTNGNVKIGDKVKINVYPSLVDSKIKRKYI